MKAVNSDGAKPPSAKKMKQAKLPFFTTANKQSSESKKRKKSDSDSDDIKVLKVLCSEKNNGMNDVNKETNVLQVIDENKDKNDSKKESVSEVEVMEVDNDKEKTAEEESKSEGEENANTSVESVHEDDGKSSPLPSSEPLDPEESELDTSSANVSLNVSSLIDNDSLVSLSDIPLTPAKASTASAKKPRRLTPKQLQRQLENQKRREEKEKEKERERELAMQEREKKKQEEKENRKRQQEEKEKQRQKEKLERQQKKQAEIDQKNEEKKAREEERRKKEEEKLQEKRRKEEERLQEKRRKEEEKLKAEEDKKRAEEEALKKKEKAALAFASFFTVKKEQKEAPPPQAEEIVTVENRNFMPFSVKADMRLAPSTRYCLKPQEKKALDKDFVCQENSKLYLEQLKDENYKPKTSSKTWPYSEELDDIVIIENKCPGNEVLMSTGKKEKMKAKLLLFNENRRPAYWGTWRKKSKCIRPRQPLAQDKTYFDYEVDSDDEWEEEEQGESLHGSDDEKESEDEYEVDNQMFVPHGYLSDDEEGLDEVVPPEMKKETLKVKEMEFQAEMKKKLKPLKPEIMGLFWQYPESPTATLTEWEWMYEGLKQFQVVRWTAEVPCFPPQGTQELEVDMDVETSTEARKNNKNNNSNNGNGNNSAQRGARQKVVPEEAIPDFIRMLHGNQKSKRFLAKEFVEYWEKLKNPDYKQEVAEEEAAEPGNNNSAMKTNRLISLANGCRTLKSLASWIQFPEEGPMHLKYCWYVPPEVRAKHNLTDLPLPNNWSYTLQNVKQRGRPKEDKATDEANTSLTTEETVPNKGTPKESLITKFTKKLSEAERKEQIKRKSSVEIAATPPNKIKIKSVTSSPFSSSSAFRISPSTSSPAAPVGIKAYCTPSSSKSSPSSTPGSEFKAPAPVRTPTSGSEKKGRRVSILVSVPCGQEIPTEAAQAAADTFLKQSAPPVARAFKFSQAASSSNANEDDDCVMLE